ncbi:MAG TPA: glycosyltransferase family 39 protein [Roseiflexaceae bacterium]|nr:glycosyltransferase family 39 protein [Roseiflexaceae bacterium]
MKPDLARPTTYDAPLQPDIATPARAARGLLASGLPYLPLLAIVLLGIGLRLWMIGISPLDPSYSNADDGDYYRRALRFALTGQYIDDNWLIRPPLHVFFYALWLRLAILIGRPALGVPLIQVAQTVLAGLTIGLGYGIGRRLFASAPAGLLFALFLSIWYSFVEQPSVLFSELIYLFLFLLHVWLLLLFDSSGRRRYLALSGLALGAATLTRSPALYSLAFVVLWLFVRGWTKDQRSKTKDQSDDTPRPHYSWSLVLGHSSLVVACCLAIVLPWTARNYLVYQRFIPVDTLGQINLWLDLDSVSKRDDHISELRRMPQADRAPYALARARQILAADPLRPFRPMWETFRHIWKLQFVEDYFVKRSFFTRPLRESAPLGLAGDLLWLVFTLCGLIGLARPAREGWHNRLFMLAWLGYSLLTVLIFHVEPRYLLPIWTLLALYGAWVLAGGLGLGRLMKVMANHRSSSLVHGPWYVVLIIIQAALAIGFIGLLLSYRDYPAVIASGMAREREMRAGERAYAANDFPAAEQAFHAALVAQPDFVDARAGLALALTAQGRREEAVGLLTRGDSRRSDLLLGVLAGDMGDTERARATIARSEAIAGEDIQAWALEWLRPQPRAAIALDGAGDIGYISGFSGAEGEQSRRFRWLKGDGRVVLPLPTPLRPQQTAVLRLTGGQPGITPLDVWMGGRWVGRVPVESGSWRDYRLPVPPELAGQRQIAIGLSAPTFVPAMVDASSADLRALSLMISAVRVE